MEKRAQAQMQSRTCSPGGGGGGAKRAAREFAQHCLSDAHHSGVAPLFNVR